MSRHQAYRNYDYEQDLDEFDGEDYVDDEDDELSPEDRAQLTAATAEVMTALGPQADKVTTQQVEEALWYYNYGVDKAIAYLINKFIDPAPTPAAKSKPQKTTPASSDDLWRRSATFPRPRPCFAGFFDDMPWFNIPKNRETFFIEPPQVAGGLLGGSGAAPKLSKLQVLAASRKKKGEEKKTEDKVDITEEKLKTLSLEKVGPKKENINSALVPTSKRRKPEPEIILSSKSHEDEETSDMSRTGDSTLDTPELSARKRQRFSHDEPPLERANPSAFAQTLCGPASAAPAPQLQQTFAPPYMAYISPSDITKAFSQPSPDDIVLAAQSKAAGKKTSSNKPNGKKNGGTYDVANDLKVLKVADTPLPKSRNLNVLSEYEKSKKKKSASFVVVGHVDAGKSTLMGRLLLDLGVVDQRTVEKYRKEAETMGKSSFALAWILDQRIEERSRGVTIDIATNKFETETTSFTILDAPGHRDFIPNMIAGASQADFAILVIDSAKGAFEAGLKGQTKEHSQLLRSMGVLRIIVAVNKLDTVEWDKERFDEISQQVSGFLTSIGFPAKNVAFVPVSGLNGDNLVRRSQETAASWFTGLTLIEELENSEPMARALDSPLRLTISEVYRTTLSPLTISGRLDAGSLQTGDALLVQPSGEKGYVKSLELDGDPVDWAVAGQHVVINLSNIETQHVRVGDIICLPSAPIQCIDTFTMKALSFDILMPMQVDVHRGRLHAAGQITELVALLHKSTGAVIKKKPKIVKPATISRIVVKMNEKVPLEKDQRVVLRSNGDTVAAGLLD